MKKYIFPLIALTFFPGCEEFVDEAKPTADVTVSTAFASTEGVQAVFTGIYRRLRWYGAEDDDPVGGGHDAIGIGAILNTWNISGNDFLRIQFHWFTFDYRYQAREAPNGRKVNLVWKMMYEIIATCNSVISNIESSGFGEDAINQYVAEARAIRGWAYHHLIVDYAQPYALGTGAAGVPIYIEETTGSTATEGKPRSPVGEVYDQILSDLEFASDTLTRKREYKWAMDKNVVDGLLARVYLHMGSYDKAALSAKAARQGYGLAADQYKNGFQDLSDKEWMWGAPQTNTQTLYYASFASVWGPNSRYPQFHANPSFVENFSASDVRNLFAIDSATADPYLYSTTKFTPASDFGEDVVLMRVAEMYLIEAEALARQGKDDEAVEVLRELQADRDSEMDTNQPTNTGQALIDEIMLERRKELYGERGVDFIDARRLGIGLERDDSHLKTYQFKLVSGDKRYILKLPQDEIDNNDFISEADQNP